MHVEIFPTVHEKLSDKISKFNASFVSWPGCTTDVCGMRNVFRLTPLQLKIIPQIFDPIEHEISNEMRGNLSSNVLHFCRYASSTVNPQKHCFKVFSPTMEKVLQNFPLGVAFDMH